MPEALPFYFLAACIICLVIYIFSKKMILYAIASSGHGFALSIKKGVMGGKDISPKDLDRIEDIVMRLAHTRNESPNRP